MGWQHRGSRRRNPWWRRSGGLPAWLAAGPLFSFRPTFANVDIDGATNVVNLRSEVGPAADTLTQASAPLRPAWIATSLFPSGVPAVAGDAATTFLSGAAMAWSNQPATAITMYTLLRPVTTGGTRTAQAFGDSTGAGLVRAGSSGGGFFAGAFGGIAFGSATAATPVWTRLTYDASDVRLTDSLGGDSGLVAAAPGTTDLFSWCVQIVAGAPGSFSDAQIAWGLGYARVVPDAESGGIEADVAAYGGI